MYNNIYINGIHEYTILATYNKFRRKLQVRAKNIVGSYYFICLLLLFFFLRSTVVFYFAKIPKMTFFLRRLHKNFVSIAESYRIMGVKRSFHAIKVYADLMNWKRNSNIVLLYNIVPSREWNKKNMKLNFVFFFFYFIFFHNTSWYEQNVFDWCIECYVNQSHFVTRWCVIWALARFQTEPNRSIEVVDGL